MTPVLDAVRREKLEATLRDIDYLIDDVVADAYVRGAEGLSTEVSPQAAKTLHDAIAAAISGTTLALLAYIAELEAGPKGVWPDFIAPPKYDNPAKGWEDPELPDFRLIWATARKLGWAIGLHGSMKRDCDLIATPWVESAAPPEALLEELCKALNAREVGDREAKPGSRVALNIQIDGWNKLIDLSIVGVPQIPLVTAVPTLTWPDGTTYQFSIEQGRRAIAAALLPKASVREEDLPFDLPVENEFDPPIEGEFDHDDEISERLRERRERSSK